jgi:hypothetical protein
MSDADCKPVRMHKYFNNCACRLLVETPRGRRVFTGRLYGRQEMALVPGRPSSRRAEFVEMTLRSVEEVTPAPGKDGAASR